MAVYFNVMSRSSVSSKGFSPNAAGDPHHSFPAAAKANYEAYLAYLENGRRGTTF